MRFLTLGQDGRRGKGGTEEVSKRQMGGGGRGGQSGGKFGETGTKAVNTEVSLSARHKGNLGN